MVTMLLVEANDPICSLATIDFPRVEKFFFVFSLTGFTCKSFRRNDWQPASQQGR
jgi:hypothetical protein